MNLSLTQLIEIMYDTFVAVDLLLYYQQCVVCSLMDEIVGATAAVLSWSTGVLLRLQ